VGQVLHVFLLPSPVGLRISRYFFDLMSIKHHAWFAAKAGDLQFEF
jgi:hypothetical protein